MTREWKGKHQYQHDTIKAGYRFIWPPQVTERWESEFEAALVQRGQAFKKAAEAYERWLHDTGEIDG